MNVFGCLIDNENRCQHYSSKADVVSIKFKCCNKYYSCYKCHEKQNNHDVILWERNEFNQKAILCGVCKLELSISEYLAHKNCIHCGFNFNPNCTRHYHKYFKI
ncbi:CHY zinc finger protein [Bacillus sp. JJ722]|uniref:CHY zinc finger protein n=1 Tax=Bacillus sp. JJ722 TaxID=3122973 RepID=UPI002FFE4EDD